MIMARKIELKREELVFGDNEIEGFIEKVVTPFGTSAKVDVPRKYVGRKAYVIITKKTDSQ